MNDLAREGQDSLDALAPAWTFGVLGAALAAAGLDLDLDAGLVAMGKGWRFSGELGRAQFDR